MDERRQLFRGAIETRTDKCILWPFDRGQRTFGRIIWQGVARDVMQLSCTYWHGPPPDGALIHRVCSEPTCINGWHLWWSMPDHMPNMFVNDRLRIAFGTHTKPKTELSDDDVRDIRRRVADGKKQKDLAVELGLSISALNRIVNRVTFREVV